MSNVPYNQLMQGRAARMLLKSLADGGVPLQMKIPNGDGDLINSEIGDLPPVHIDEDSGDEIDYDGDQTDHENEVCLSGSDSGTNLNLPPFVDSGDEIDYDGDQTDHENEVCLSEVTTSDHEDEEYVPESTDESDDSIIYPELSEQMVVKSIESGDVSDLDEPTEKDAPKKKKPKIRPERSCPFCAKVVKGGKLKLHVTRVHKDEPGVKQAKSLPKKEKNEFFNQLRYEGMYQYNVKVLGDPDYDVATAVPKLMKERKTKAPSKPKMCSGCKRFFASSNFYKHKSLCSGDSAPINVHAVYTPNLHEDEEFAREILSKFRNNEIGDLIRTNQIIQQIGYRAFSLKRHESSKKDEVRKNVMMEMRELARLYSQFKVEVGDDVTIEAMFTRNHIGPLKDAINAMCEANNDGKKDEKYALKLNINAVLIRSMASLKGLYAEQKMDDAYEELLKFEHAYKWGVPVLVAFARYKSHMASVDKRRPDMMPMEKEIKALKEFIDLQLADISIYTMQKYTWLRSLVIARLTLFNARRGDEPSRILVKEWVDADKDVWINVQDGDDVLQKYLKNYKLAYIIGKGKRYVPVLIPNNTHKAINTLLSLRNDYGVNPNNEFLFATKASQSHMPPDGMRWMRSVKRQASR